MEHIRRNVILTGIALIVRKLLDSPSSESDDKELQINKRRKVSRVQNYVEEILPALTIIIKSLKHISGLS